MIWTAKQIEDALSIKIKSDINDKNKASYGRVEFNSQNIKEGDIFIALPGRRDGHEFVADALNRGASAAIISKNIPDFLEKDFPKNKLIRVDNTLESLSLLAEYKRNKSNAKIIAITGSVGKTSTKEAIRVMLEPYGNVHASYGTFNNALGVDLTLASMPDNTDYAIIEMGMNSKGELNELSNRVTPDIALITTISEGHLKFFNSVEEIADAKCEIFAGLDINKAIAIINRDIDLYEHCLHNIDVTRIKHIQTFGKSTESGVRFVSHEIIDNDSTRLVYEIDKDFVELIVKDIIPIHLAENFAAAFAVVGALGLDVDLSVNAISNFKVILGRGSLASVNREGKSFKIICDYYNSNPQSLQASLEHLAQFDNSKKTAILGDMNELGEAELSLHQKMIPYIENSGISKLFLVGNIMPKIKNDISKNILVLSYKNVDDLIQDIDRYLIQSTDHHIQDEELILIKGSRSLKLEKLAQYLGVHDVL